MYKLTYKVGGGETKLQVLSIRSAALMHDVSTLLPSDRQYVKLRIIAAQSYDLNEKFWTRIAGELVDLEFRDCAMSARVYYLIFQRCRKLESLAFTGKTFLTWLPDLSLRNPRTACVAKVEVSLRNVTCLSLQDNRFVTGSKLVQLLRLTPNVASLNLARCKKLDLTVPESACLERRFLSLNLGNIFINNNPWIEILEQSKGRLRELRLRGFKSFIPAIYEAIGKCTKLRFLSLQATLESGRVESMLSKTLELEYLNLTCSRMTDLDLSIFTSRGTLRHLDLRFCLGLSVQSLSNLGDLKTLQYLCLNVTNCDDSVMRKLVSLEDLRVLKLRSCYNLNTEGIALICDNFKKLEKLNLEGCENLSDEAGVKFHQLKQLQALNVVAAENVTDKFFANALGSTDMKILKMGNMSLTDSALVGIAKHHGRLEYLRLCDVDHITDAGLEHVVKNLPRLRKLWLNFCPSISHRSIEVLQQNCPDLHTLKVHHCTITKEALDSFGSRRPGVDIYHVEIPTE